jgi:hypothetical protein
MSHVLDTPESIATYRLFALHKAFEFKARTGMSLTRNMPRIKDVCEEFRFEGVRTNAQLSAALLFLHNQVREGCMYYELKNGLCHFYLAAGTEDEFAEAIKNA